MSRISDNLDMLSYKRTLHLPIQNSFILLGPRGTGKSTLLDVWKVDIFDPKYKESILTLDLLDPDCEERYSLRPVHLKEEIEESGSKIKWVIIDEAQKIPQLLDIAQWSIQKKKICFAITGSSARKLKRGSANLLAGRAHAFHLHPFTHEELGSDFKLDDIIGFGSLPEVFSFKTEIEKKRYLKSYCQTYLREEIQLEQIVRNMQRFRKFLNFAAQMNGQILNFSKMSRLST
ncbi:MAG: AAA family ATPase, partial [Deltaproteobacteria bacterium]|nr:AAA family ATPase [Deltaproteobacteria bacterium]